jgi:Thioredoxin domain
MIQLKILSYRSPQRYVVRRVILAAQAELCKELPGLKLDIIELKDWAQIEHYTPVLSAPSLVVNGKLVCTGRFPSRDEVLGWLKIAIEE